MSSTFPYVELTPEQEAILGRRQPNSRIYRYEGAEEVIGPWFEALSKAVGPTISPGGVRMFCPVSRAAVHKRAKEGKLSLFLFHVTHQKTTLFGKRKTTRNSPYCYIPVTEAKAWRAELEERALRQGVVTQEELEGSKPDWHGKFMEWPVWSERPGPMDSIRELGLNSSGGLRAALKAVAQTKASPTRKKAPPPSK